MLDFGFSRVIQTDGARVFTGQEFQEFLQNNKIQHRLSAPMASRSNGRAEQKIKAYKNMLTKLFSEGRTTEADARSTWELLNLMPSKPGEFSPARIAFRRERRHPLIPAIPAEGGEIEQGRKQQEDKEREQVRRNSKRGKNVKKNPTLPTGSTSPDTEVHLWKCKKGSLLHTPRKSHFNQTKHRGEVSST